MEMKREQNKHRQTYHSPVLSVLGEFAVPEAAAEANVEGAIVLVVM